MFLLVRVLDQEARERAVPVGGKRLGETQQQHALDEQTVSFEA